MSIEFVFRKIKIKWWKRKCFRETLFLLKIQNGVHPPIRQSIHVVINGHGLQKRPSRNIFVFQQAEFLCVGLKENRHPTGCLKVDSRKRSFFIPTINDATCSNSIIYYLNKETRRVKRENYSIDRMISLHLQWLWNSNSHWRWRENLLSLTDDSMG